MKIISTLLVALFALASLANAKSNIAPKIVLTVDAQSAKTVCPEPGQVVKITIITAKMTRTYTIDPRAKGEKEINPAVSNFSTEIMNKGDKLGLATGLTVAITTADGKTYKQENVSIPTGIRNDTLELLCSYFGQPPGREWEIKPWAD